MHKILENFDVTDLPSLPHVLVELVEACHRVDVTYDELAQCVEKDPTLTAMVLNFVGAKRSGSADRLSSFSDLIRRLGRNTLRSLAINCAAGSGTSEIDPDSLLQFWRHAVRCAVTARLLAQRTGYASPDEAYLAGLLHNIGELVLHTRFPAKYRNLRQAVDDELQQVIQESDQFGISHAELGAHLIERWNLNSFMADAARYHHQPEDYVVDAHPLVPLIHLAQRMSLRDAAPNQALFDSADRLFGLNQVSVMDLLSQANERVGELGRSLDLREETVRDLMVSAEPTGKAGALARKIQHVALLGGVRLRPEDPADPDGLLGALLQGALILAGVPRGLCFLYDAESQCLRGQDAEDALVPEFAIRLDGRSLISRSLEDDRLVHSFEPDSPAPTVVDRQIMDRLGAGGLLCLPLRSGESRVGTLVLGIQKSRLQRLLERNDLLEQYAREATTELLAARATAQTEPSAASGDADARTRQIVHEVNNPLSIIRNYLQVLSIKLGDDHPALGELKIIEEELLRASGLIQQLTQAPSDMATKRETVSLNALIEDLIKLSATTLKSVVVDLDLDPALPPIESDGDALKQVLINLMKNAVEAMDGSGRLSLRTRDWYQVDGTPYVELEVADTGPGIPDHIQRHLFHPVNSTKSGHAGLGLSIVKKLIDSLEGSIGHRTGEGAGTTFRILLPRVVVERRARPAEGPPEVPRRKQELPEG